MDRSRGGSLWWAGVIGPIPFTALLLIIFVVVGLFSIEPDAPFHAIAGLLQRVPVLEWFTCLIVLALRMRSLSQAHTA